MHNSIKNKVLDRTNNYRELLVTNRVNVVKNVHISRASAARGVEYKQRRVTLILYQNYPSFLAPQTEIPLAGEMSRSDKRVTARYEQLVPVTLNMLSATTVASLYRYDK